MLRELLLAAYGGVAAGTEKSLRGVAVGLLRPFRTGQGRHTMGGCGALGRQTVLNQPNNPEGLPRPEPPGCFPST